MESNISEARQNQQPAHKGIGHTVFKHIAGVGIGSVVGIGAGAAYGKFKWGKAGGGAMIGAALGAVSSLGLGDTLYDNTVGRLTGEHKAAAEGEKDDINLKDPATRQLLHDESAIRASAWTGGAATGLLTAATASPVAIGIAPTLVGEFRKTEAAMPFMKRMAAVAGKNKFGAAMTAFSTLAIPVGAAIGYFSTKKTLRKKQAELAKLEVAEQSQVTPSSEAQQEGIHTEKGSWASGIERERSALKSPPAR